MFNPLASTTVNALEQTLAFTEKRHLLLASNLANMSTPDYRSRDLDVQQFQAALAESIQAGADPARPNRSASGMAAASETFPFPSPAALFQRDLATQGIPAGALGHPDLSDWTVDEAGPLEQLDANKAVPHGRPMTREDQFSGPRSAMEAIVYHDNSDVSLEQQVTQISKNKHLHDVAITTLRSQFSLMRAAITERA